MQAIGPYRVLGHIGAGGMGEVYLAEDTRLHRKVALKMLRDDASDHDAHARLMREARAVAALNHPHIAAIYDVVADQSESRSVIVMEYVPGETLAERLRRGRLAVADVIAIGIDIADALASAHAQGVVHRDLKPANVRLMPDGGVKVLDFGLARTSSRGSIETAARSTGAPDASAGHVAGTPGYMAPEQIRGGSVDARTDIYSFGVLLFETIAGRRPFPGDLITAALTALTQQTPRLRDADGSVPPALDALVARMMAVDPDARPANALDVARELRDIRASLHDAASPHSTSRRRTLLLEYAAVTVVALIAIAAVGLVRYRRAPDGHAPRRIVAVLPLDDLGGGGARQYLGVGIADTLAAAISKIDGVTVVSRAEVQEAVAQTRDPKRLAQTLGASLLVDGSVQQAAGRLRVTLRGVGPDGQVRWSDAYEDAATAVFPLQRTIAGGVVRELQGGAAPVEAALPPTSDAQALTAYWQGESLAERAVSRRDFDDAIALFKKAADADPRFALAYAGLGQALWREYTTFHDEALTRQALEAGLTALRLDPGQPAVMVAVATIYNGLGQYDAAADVLRRALQIQPDDDDAHRALGQVQLNQGKADDALAEYRAAIAARPTRWINYYELGRADDRLRRLTDAAAAYQRAIELRPNDPRLYTNLGVAYARMGDNVRAVENFERSNALVPTRLGFQNIGTIDYRLGRFTDAIAAYKSALQIDANSQVLHGNLGDAYLRVGRAADAAREFEAARTLATQTVDVNAKNATALSQLAVFEAKLHRFPDATRHAADAVNLAPTDPEVQYKAAVVAALEGLVPNALASLKRAIQLGYSATEARDDYDLRALQAMPEFADLTRSH